MQRLPLHQRPYFAKRILEVGCGHNPYKGITHAVDKYPANNYERNDNLSIPAGVDFREGDLENLPFKNGEDFDFLYASHVYEHVSNPEKAVGEINRLCKKGYLETPSPLKEQMSCEIPFNPTDMHRLYVWADQNTNSLFAIKKNEKTVGQFCACINGQRAEKMSELARSGKVNLDPLLPSRARATKFFFKQPINLKVYPDFISACKNGHCAYKSVEVGILAATSPFFFVEKRLWNLRKIMRQHLGTRLFFR